MSWKALNYYYSYYYYYYYDHCYYYSSYYYLESTLQGQALGRSAMLLQHAIMGHTAVSVAACSHKHQLQLCRFASLTCHTWYSKHSLEAPSCKQQLTRKDGPHKMACWLTSHKQMRHETTQIRISLHSINHVVLKKQDGGRLTNERQFAWHGWAWPPGPACCAAAGWAWHPWQQLPGPACAAPPSPPVCTP